jgi:hypothetical protein
MSPRRSISTSTSGGGGSLDRKRARVGVATVRGTKSRAEQLPPPRSGSNSRNSSSRSSPNNNKKKKKVQRSAADTATWIQPSPSPTFSTTSSTDGLFPPPHESHHRIPTAVWPDHAPHIHEQYVVSVMICLGDDVDDNDHHLSKKRRRRRRRSNERGRGDPSDVEEDEEEEEEDSAGYGTRPHYRWAIHEGYSGSFFPFMFWRFVIDFLSLSLNIYCGGVLFIFKWFYLTTPTLSPLATRHSHLRIQNIGHYQGRIRRIRNRGE